MRIPKPKVEVSLPSLKTKTQKIVNKWIRERDKDELCISCGRWGDGDAGHFIAQGSSGALRYEPDNIHKQCKQCNVWKRGNLIEYRIGLVKKIGEERVKYLEDHRHDIKHWTREELKEVMEMYKL